MLLSTIYFSYISYGPGQNLDFQLQMSQSLFMFAELRW